MKRFRSKFKNNQTKYSDSKYTRTKYTRTKYAQTSERLGLVFLVIGTILMSTITAGQAASWRSIVPDFTVNEVAIEVSGESFTYYVLASDEPTVLQVRGPRRLKIITRYLFGPEDPEQQDYRVRILIDGREILRKSFTSQVKNDVVLSDGFVGASLRKCYVDISTGVHTVQVFGATNGAGRVAARFYRESKRQQTGSVPYAPDEFDAVYQLQFASGNQSTYYHFGANKPLGFTVTGPTTLKIYTRLDFDHTMNGSQSYALEVYCDGELHRSFHYHTQKLSTATYIERPDILPGSRKTMRIPVPKGQHRLEIKCMRPENCGVSAQIRIPRADISSR